MPDSGRPRDASVRAILTFSAFAAFFTAFFVPATFGKLMASGDALDESLPALRGAHHLWENAILIGYPMYADPNQQSLYPLAWLASIGNAYNVFAVAPFVLAAFGMWGFVRELTRSSLAAVVAALVYALGGFMISHAGHEMIAHPAAWVPYALWSFELLRAGKRRIGMPLGAVAIGFCALAGQPQVLAFTVPVLAAFAAASARGAANGAASYLKTCGFTAILGLGIGALQLVPEANLARSSTRASLDFGSFVFLKIPVSQFLTRMIFPYASGVSQLPGFAFSRIDLGAFTEDTLSVGTVALVLAALGAAGALRDRRIFVWIVVAVAGLALSLGDATPLAALTYHLPLYNLLRIPGRHAFEWTLAVAVLASYGALAIERRTATLRSLLVATALVCAIAAGAYVQFAAGTASTADFVAQTVGVPVALVRAPLANGALAFPLASGLIGTIAVFGAFALRDGRAAASVVIAALAIDVCAFAYPAYWNWGAISEASLAPTAFARHAAFHTGSDTRVAWTAGNANSDVFRPNLPLLWGVPTVDGYTPLIPQRTFDLLGTLPGGGVPIPGSRDTSLDLAGVSLLAAPATDTPLNMFFSLVHPGAAKHADFGLPQPAAATALVVVSDLGESMDVPQNAKVGTFTVVFADRHVETHDVVAGRDTSEFAYDRPDVRPQMRHRRAAVFSSSGPGHTYVARYALSPASPIDHIAFDWHYPRAALTIEKLILVAPGGAERVVTTLASLWAFPSHWASVAVDPAAAAFENRGVLPRAWIAAPVRLTEAQAANAVHGGSLPNGARFDPHVQALVERDVARMAPPAAGDGVTKTSESPYALELTAACAKPCFVVTRDAYDKDWRAVVDGRETSVYATDVDLRGVWVPAGRHVIRYRFFPASLVAGAAIAALASIVLLVACVRVRSSPPERV